MRWGLTQGNYDKWAIYFGMQLPIRITVSSALSQAVYLRDAILFAYKHNLPGKEWYKKVRVSPEDKHTLIIKPIPGKEDELGVATSYPISNIMQVELTIMEGNVHEGYRLRLIDDFEAVCEVIEDTEWTIHKVFDNVVEFRRRRNSNGL